MSPRRNGSVILAAVVMAVGAIIVAPAGGIAIARAVRSIVTPVITTPAVVSRHLDRGTWLILQRDNPVLDPSQVDIVDAGGQPLEVDPSSSTQTITRGGSTFDATLQFDVPRSATYEIRFGANAGEVLVNRSLGQTARDVALPAAVAALGGFLLFGGLVGLIIALVLRGRRGPLTPAGWYPDPGNPGRQRWWDGTRWTDYQA